MDSPGRSTNRVDKLLYSLSIGQRFLLKYLRLVHVEESSIQLVISSHAKRESKSGDNLANESKSVERSRRRRRRKRIAIPGRVSREKANSGRKELLRSGSKTKSSSNDGKKESRVERRDMEVVVVQE